MANGAGGLSRLSGVFGLNFSAKALPIRRPTALTVIARYGAQFKPDMAGELTDPVLRLANTEWIFQDDTWTLTDGEGSLQPGSSVAGGNGAPTPAARPEAAPRGAGGQDKTLLRTLKEENNLLALKNEALLDMLSEVVAEMHLLDGEEPRQLR
ncbi:hypothetical protein BV898_13498 [Hypsibius exemplaris]|uniref:Protein chibby-like protein 1 n=1 Tax=Hypsibius exemplaris TaxID=2072580 RepID=A0A1W0WAI5_HYPEX|nr:hypothetical protein BV898_13498 [Hypsibius exemplaris]